MRGSQNGALSILCLIYFIFATNSVGMSVKSNEKAKTLIVPTLETKLKFIAVSEAGKRAVKIENKHRISSTTVKTSVVDKQKCEDVAKLIVFGKIKCLRPRDNVLLKMEKSLLILISDQQAKGNNEN
jgi:hypothetical protein